MQAVTVVPGQRDSLALADVPEPSSQDGSVLVDVLGVGICGTDAEIVAGAYGEAPPGHDRLILGHESLGRVREAPDDCGLAAGDLVVGIVRRPDPEPCANCAAGQWDMCRNGRYTEHGIKGADGFMRERYRSGPDRLVRLDSHLQVAGVLLEPASIVAKAWTEIDRFSTRMAYRPRTALVTGAGPVGLLAALLGRQRGLDVHVVDVVTDGPKPSLVADLGATYHSDPVDRVDVAPDVVVECTGISDVVLSVIEHTAVDGVTCLTGVSTPGRSTGIDIGGMNRRLVLQNDIVFGSVNANREHYRAAAEALGKADQAWLERMLNRRVPVRDFEDAFQRGPHDVKVVLDFAAAS